MIRTDPAWLCMSILLFVCHCFRFPEASAYFHEEEKEGVARICQLALHKKYPKYASDGYEVLYPRPPVIYLSAAAKPNLAQFICHQVTCTTSSCCMSSHHHFTVFSGNCIGKLLHYTMVWWNSVCRSVIIAMSLIWNVRLRHFTLI